MDSRPIDVNLRNIEETCEPIVAGLNRIREKVPSTEDIERITYNNTLLLIQTLQERMIDDVVELICDMYNALPEEKQETIWNKHSLGRWFMLSPIFGRLKRRKKTPTKTLTLNQKGNQQCQQQ